MTVGYSALNGHPNTAENREECKSRRTGRTDKMLLSDNSMAVVLMKSVVLVIST